LTTGEPSTRIATVSAVFKMEEQVVFCCPHCLQQSSVTVALAGRHQKFVEDCQVCCEPIAFDIEVRDGEIVRMDYEGAN